MKLFLMRHAEAQETRQIDDIFRELTNKGIKEAKEATKFLQNYQIDKILGRCCK
jgi:phosphohistidine phosphatase SixA